MRPFTKRSPARASPKEDESAAISAKTAKKSRVGVVLRTMFVPRAIGMAGQQVQKSTRNVKEALAAAREVQARRREELALPVKSVIVRGADGEPCEIDMPADPHERFELLYEVHGYDAKYLASQLRAVRMAKFASLVMTAVTFLLAIVLMTTTSMRWLSLLMVPVTMLLLAVCIAMVFRWALAEFQFTNRSLVNYKTFLAQQDFFQWIFS